MCWTSDAGSLGDAQERGQDARRTTYGIPVRIQGGVHQAMVDSGCMQAIIHLNMERPGALVEAFSVEIRCVHGNIHSHPVVFSMGEKHSVKAAISSRLMHPLILGTVWPGFYKLVGQCVAVHS